MVVTGGLDKVFCAGANIQMLAGVDPRPQGQLLQVHQRDPQRASRTPRPTRVRCGSPPSTARRQAAATSSPWPATRSCSSTIAPRRCRCPEVPLLAVLPGTGGLTRVVDKRFVRRDLADVFATRAEGVKGQQALDWGLVDAIAPRGRFDEAVRERAAGRASDVRPGPATRPGSMLTPARRRGRPPNACATGTSTSRSTASSAPRTSRSRPDAAQPVSTPDELLAAGATHGSSPPPAQLDDALLRLRFNEPEIGTWVLHTARRRGCRGGRGGSAARPRRPLAGQRGRACCGPAPSSGSTCRRARSSPLVEPGSCFAGAARRARPRRRPFVHARRRRPRRRRSRRPSSDSPPPTTAGSPWPTA